MPWVPEWSAKDGGLTHDATVDAIDEWALTLAESGVPASFGWRCTAAAGDPLLDQLESLGAAYWDFRSGLERNLASRAALTPDQVAAISGAARVLGLAGTDAPRRSHYDAVVMTGGMVRAGIVKPRFVRELVDAGVTFGEIVFLGAFRPFAGDELALARALGVAGRNEWDAMVTGLERVFPPTRAPTAVESADNNPNASWRDASWIAGEQAARVVSAPSSEPDARRADTTDTFRFWAVRAAASVRSLLVVTTPIYVPYQAAIAVRTFGLESGIDVETVAVSDTANDLGEHTQAFEAQHHLQELLSAIRGLRALRNDLVADAVNRAVGAVR